MKKDLIKKAVALVYSAEKDSAPVVSAKGWGYIAEAIIKVAQEHNIPLVEDKDLVRLLDTIEIEHEIPENAYTVVAEMYAFLYRLNKKAQEKK